MSDIVEVLSAALTPLIAVVVAYIAYQQSQTNSLRLRHEMFDRRFAIYKDVQVFLSAVMREARVVETTLPELIDARQRSRFLMGAEMEAYIDEVYGHATNAMKYQRQLEGEPGGDRRKALVKAQLDEVDWLIGQLPKLAERFGPYLNLT